MNDTTGKDLTVSPAEVRALREICGPALRSVIATGESSIAEARTAIYRAQEEIASQERIVASLEDYLMKARIAHAALERLA